MSNRIFSTALIAATTLFAAGAIAATAPKPKISMHAAKAKALAYVPHGVVKASEIEALKGVPVYSFEIASPRRGGIDEIEMSGLTGKLISRQHEPSAQEKREPAEAKEH